jgi:outer membrane usher protein FimD/PapC
MTASTPLLLNYNFTGNNVHNDVGGSSNYAYLNLQSGLNLGAWRLRDNTTWSYSSGAANNENQWQHINTWLSGYHAVTLAPDPRRQLHQRRYL